MSAPAPRGHVQLPRSLLYSAAHSGLAVWVWSMYETLMPHGIDGGRAPAIARRRFLAERAGVSTTALDEARRQLLAQSPDGPYLSRSTPRGAKRSVLHAAQRLPRESGERYAAVPAWTLDLVWAGRRRPDERISAEAWRLYAAAVDRASRDGQPRPFDTTMGRLGAALDVSASTSRRRLAELENAGLIEVTERPGGWLTLRVVLTPEAAAEAAERFTREGRRRAEPRPDPCHRAALTPARNRQSPLADSGTPQEAPLPHSPTQEPPPPPAAGAYSNQTPKRAPAGKPKPATKHRARQSVPRAAAELYRALPTELTRHIPEHGSQRVLTALTTELQHRTPAELRDRLSRNWEHWRYRTTTDNPIRDATAVAIRLTRRGLHCPDVRCEDGHQLNLDGPCKACAQEAEHATASRPRPKAQPSRLRETEPQRPPTATSDYVNPPARSTPSPAAAAVRPRTVDGRDYGALARRLLQARTEAERDAVETAWSKTRTA